MKIPAPKHLPIAICLGLAAGTLALYCPVLWHGFLNYDDPDYILDNPHVKAGLTWPGIVWAFKSGYAANWHPLTWISHMADCQFFGLNPAGHHLVNLLFHTANTLLLFVLLKQLTGALWRSAFVAALFAWHPLHVESVAWAAERKDVLSAFFWLLTLLAYTRYTRTSSLRSFLFYFLSLVLFACGLMSKPMVVTLPFVLLLLDFWPLQRFPLPRMTLPNPQSNQPPQTTEIETANPTRKSQPVPATAWLLIEKIPFFALTAASCVITLFVQKGALWSTASLPFQYRLANTLMSYVRYLSKIFLPANLALIYPYPHSWPLIGVIGAGTVLVMLTVIFVVAAKRFPYLIVGWLWFLGTLVPVIGLVQVGVQAMADRYTYLPSIGIFILVTWGAADLLASSSRKTSIAVFAGGCALIACLILTTRQLSYWKSSLTIFLHTVTVTSGNYAADDCLGKTLHNMGRPDLAAPYYNEAVALEPDYPMAQFDLAMNLLAQGDAADASNHLAAAVQLWPRNPDMQYDFGVFLSQHGHPRDAARHFTEALAVRPDFPKAREALGQLQTNSIANHSTP